MSLFTLYVVTLLFGLIPSVIVLSSIIAITDLLIGYMNWFLILEKVIFILLCSILFLFLILGVEALLRNIKKKPDILVDTNKRLGPISVVMTAYNDEDAIGEAVADFINRENVDEIIVIDNNSTDRTNEIAKKGGARIVYEPNQGYGFACQKAMISTKNDIVVLVEGDCTYTGSDIKKLTSYLDCTDLVLGTRTTRELTAIGTQMNWFLNWGNFFLAKLLQLRFWGDVRLTDVGCTYRVLRKENAELLKKSYNAGGNHFSPHMIKIALSKGLKVIEIPITFHPRKGESKVAGKNFWSAFKLGLRMLVEIYF